MWPDDGDRLTTVCIYYKKLWNWAQRLPPAPEYSSFWLLWAKHLAYAATKFLTLRGEPRQSAVRLMEFGLRRCSEFLNTQTGAITLEQQLLGLCNAKNFLSLMKDDLEGTIRFIRDLVPTNLPSGRRSNELLIIWRIVPGSYHWSTCFPDAITRKHYRWCDTYSLSGAQTTTQDIILHRGRWTVERGEEVEGLRISTPDRQPADKFSNMFASHISPRLDSALYDVEFKAVFGNMRNCGIGVYKRQNRGLAKMTTSKEAPNLTVDVEDVLEILEKDTASGCPPSLESTPKHPVRGWSYW